MQIGDTIVALSSSLGHSARGIIRLSGPQSLTLTAKVFQPAQPAKNLNSHPSWSRITGSCRLGQSITSCPCEIYIFSSPNSYTTEEMAELHLPSSPALLQMVLHQLLTAGARQAQPGEFTARAFFNGRIDLTEAQAVAAAISARSDIQLRAAERLLDGHLHRTCTQLTDKLADVLALVEAQIDFSQEEIELASQKQLLDMINEVYDPLDQLLQQSTTWDNLDHLAQVVLAGPANSGKSTLINRLTGLDRSIVSVIAGTTRDQLTAPLSLDCGECMLIDSAGMGESADPLAQVAQGQTRKSLRGCDLLLWVIDITDIDNPANLPPANLELPNKVIIIANKTDLSSIQSKQYTTQIERLSAIFRAIDPVCIADISALKGDNIDDLKETICQVISNELPTKTADETLALTALQIQSLQNCRDNLKNAIRLLSKTWQERAELLALELRGTLDELGKISGEMMPQEVINRIFSRFCIGK